jgi:hypothetical protein
MLQKQHSADLLAAKNVMWHGCVIRMSREYERPRGAEICTFEKSTKVTTNVFSGVTEDRELSSWASHTIVARIGLARAGIGKRADAFVRTACFLTDADDVQ